MYELSNPQTLAAAAEHLRAHDPKLAPIIDASGLCTIQPHANYYQDLVETIIGQQLSVKAAATIRKRFMELFGGSLPEPATILQKSTEELRGVGLSGRKAAYIRDLAQHVVDGRVRFDHLGELSNEQIITELTDIKGIGEWSVHMFLMFCMGRMDVLAHGDLGIRSGIKKVYGLDHLPSPKDVQAIAAQNHWHPYESIACWYIWRALDNKPM